MLTLSHNKISRQSLLFIIKNYGHGSFNPQPKKKKKSFFTYFIMVICSVNTYFYNSTSEGLSIGSI